jgi:hypothetical protein
MHAMRGWWRGQREGLNAHGAYNVYRMLQRKYDDWDVHGVVWKDQRRKRDRKTGRIFERQIDLNRKISKLMIGLWRSTIQECICALESVVAKCHRPMPYSQRPNRDRLFFGIGIFLNENARPLEPRLLQWRHPDPYRKADGG